MDDEITFVTCLCGSDTFIRIYNVWNEKIKVEEFKGGWSVIELGKEKDHLVGYICAECRQDADILNDGL